ncbi:unnamed protein product [Dibothriocephalus latus]|uniref:RRM domain-containing protein n=1 Tax=Dibothriocephalus latus TaxID=60516 RepID=A0A3P6PLZ3_DIBLA|nr:unnamed protein product [Dibothriocephalus latus]
MLIGAGLASLNLLIQQQPATAADQAEVSLQNATELQSMPISEAAASPNVNKEHYETPSVRLNYQPETTTQEAPGSGLPGQQHQHQQTYLQNIPAVDESHKALELYVDGLSADIDADTLRTYFASFGEVLDVDISVDAPTGQSSEHTYITLRATVDTDQILKTKHVVRGVSINVEEFYSSDDSTKNAQSFAEIPKQEHEVLEQLPPTYQLENAEQKEPCLTETLQEQQLPSSEQHHDLQIQETVCPPQKLLELYVDGLSAAITSENLKIHFEQFGEVLDVDMSGDDSTNAPSGNAYITLQPTGDPNKILETEHVVCGVPIRLEECFSSDDSENNSER